LRWDATQQVRVERTRDAPDSRLLQHAASEAVSSQVARLESLVTDVAAAKRVVTDVSAAQTVVPYIAAADMEDGI
jgi:hypothetical protein